MSARHERHQTAGGAGARSIPGRVIAAWGVLESERRLAAAAAVAMFITMLLPWYSKSYTVIVKGSAKIASTSLSAFQDFSFVEAAVLLVSAGVLTILFARAERRPFQLPGGDGLIIMLAGAWCALLIFYRLLSKPSTAATQKISTTIGIQWGIFFALAAAGLLAYAGSRIRGGQRPEPPLVRRRATPPDPGPPEEQATTVVERSVSEPTAARQRPRYPPRPGSSPPSRPERRSTGGEEPEQLSFDDPPTR
jgi:hypothetical protein